MKEISFVELPGFTSPSTPPPDGDYAVVDYNGDHEAKRRGFSREHVFPWNIVVYRFKDGLCDDIAHGSSVSSLLTSFEVAKVLLVGIDAVRRAELDAELAEVDIVLVPEQVSV